MKYLKKFNEKIFLNTQDLNLLTEILEDFCE